jgi:signal transduction histidine kinase/DNA-binding response OmpR family regulator/ligand-binding sensor domain-containing protein
MNRSLLLLYFCFPILLSAQEFASDLYFTSLDLKTTRTIATVFEDSRGFLWFGGSGGLCRYDGTAIKRFRAHPIDTTSLSGAIVDYISEDKEGTLWISTRGRGLNAYDHETGIFKHYLHNPKDDESISSNVVRRTAVDESGMIWIGFNEVEGLNALDPKTGKSQRFVVQKGKQGQLQGKVLGDIRILGDRIYLGTTVGFEYYDKATEQFHFLPLLDEKGDTIYYTISSLQISQDGKIWMNMPGEGIRVYDPTTDEVAAYPITTKAGKQTPKIDVIREGKDGRLWFIGDKQLWSIAHDRKTLQQHTASEEMYAGLFEDAFIIDRYGMLWVRDKFYDPRRSLFKYYQIESEEDDQPVFVDGVEVMSDSLLKITSRQDYYTQNIYSKEIKYLDRTTIPLAPIGTIDVDPQQVKWAGMKVDGKMVMINPTTQQAYFFRIEKAGKPMQLMEMGAAFDRKKDFWIATWGNGLIRIKYEDWQQSDGVITQFDQWLPQTNQPSLPTANLLWVMVDRDDNIWVSSSVGGLTRIDGEDESIQRYDFEQGENTVSDTYVFTTAEDKAGNIWIATNGGGLNKYDPKTQKFTVFNQENGLIDDELFRLYSDANGDLWMNNVTGIAYLDTETEQFIQYNQNDGVRAWRTNGQISEKTGLLAWGDHEGFMTAYVDSIKNRPTYASDIVLTGINVYNAKQKESEALQPVAWEENKLELSHHQNTLALTFSILDFRNRVKHRYQYSLTQSNSPEWIDLKDRQEVSLNQLAPGTYYFHLKGQNSDLIWSELEQPLKIIIQPPFWQTSWAYLVYALLIGNGFFTFYRFNLNRQLERQEAKQLQEINNLKSRFYTNITHEFRTPLTVILGMAQEEKDFSKARTLITRNGEKLLQLINQLLDLSKIDTGHLKVNYQQIEIVSFTQYIVESFQSLADRKYIRLTIYSKLKELYMDMDEEKYRQIISNLLSNAIKFTPESGKIILHISQQNDQLCIKVTDNGVGIASDQLPYVFDRFYQVDPDSDRDYSKQCEGTGIGLALVKELIQLLDGKIDVDSKIQVGTTFTLRFPIRQTSTQKLEHFVAPSPDIPSLEKADLAYPSPATPEEADLPRLLIIEDNADVVTYIQSLLQTTYQLLIARNGEVGIEKAIEETPDIIISDVMMPKKNGFEVVETLKQDIRTSHIPIILLTAKATQEDKIEGLKYGADAYLMKPFNKEELFIRLNNLIEVRRQLQQKYANGILNISETSAPLSIEDQFLLDVRQQIAANYTKADFNVETLAASLSMSRVQLFRKLKAISKQTPSQLIRQFRLEKAKELLQNQQLNISEIAYELGYSDPNYFIRQFKNKFGVSPNAYRKSL